ncbi:MAG: serine--tRNA ligase [Candidatus Helarchaeota archaeon]
MIDIKLLQTAFDEVANKLALRGCEKEILIHTIQLDDRRRAILQQIEPLRATRNKLSKEIGITKEDEIRNTKIAEVKTINDQITKFDDELKEVQGKLRFNLMRIPNIPHDTVPAGDSFEDNEVIRIENYDPQKYTSRDWLPHWDLAEQHNLLDFKRGAKLSGSNWPLYRGPGAKLVRALLEWGYDKHEGKYEEISPPYFVRTEIMEGTGHLPKFEQDMYSMRDDELWAIPTAEVPLTSLYRDEILDFSDLPKYFMAYTACFRREAGAAGRENRGLLRVHQFHKLELLKFTHPDESYNELESLLNDAEQVIKALNLPYRVVNCCMGDVGFSAAKIFDIEVYFPYLDKWFEVSSIGNFTDFQARRANIRFRDEDRRVSTVHTLNGSGISTPRVWAAIVEHGQQADGSILLPEALRDYMKMDVIKY